MGSDARIIERRGGVQVQQLDPDNGAELIKVDVENLIELDGCVRLGHDPGEGWQHQPQCRSSRHRRLKLLSLSSTIKQIMDTLSTCHWLAHDVDHRQSSLRASNARPVRSHRLTARDGMIVTNGGDPGDQYV